MAGILRAEIKSDAGNTCILTNLNRARYHTAATAKLTTNIRSDMNYVDIVVNLDTEFHIRIWAAYQSAKHMFFETIVTLVKPDGKEGL